MVCQIFHAYQVVLSIPRGCYGSVQHIPKLKPIPTVFMDRADIVSMREWASEHGQCARQLTVRQQTTKFSAGTLPMSAYSVQLQEDPLNMTDVDEEEVRTGSEEVPFPTTSSAAEGF